MNESVFIHVSSFDELAQRLHQKYHEGVAQYTSTFRYPASIIFFDSKQEYKRFIQESPPGKSEHYRKYLEIKKRSLAIRSGSGSTLFSASTVRNLWLFYP